ncbi:MAG: Cna B-type domain-containing protein [Erysipelothrix sp.]|nr:Cna B-type domain-containing protein [Erysipelothrix sp.]
MGRKYTSEVMINTVHQILDGSTSVSLAANKLNIDISTVWKWVQEYNVNGLDYFTERPRNNTYTKEFKQSVIDEYLEGTDSLLNLSLPNATEIGSSAFYNNNIKDLSLAKAKKVGYAAFHSNNLVSVDLPETEKIDIKGEKNWNDLNDKLCLRPESIKISLLANGEVVETLTVTEDDDWKWSFIDLDKYQDGEEIVNSISETSVDHYSSEIDGFNVTNTLIPDKTSLQIIKVWKDDGTLRPESIVIKLYENSVEILAKS